MTDAARDGGEDFDDTVAVRNLCAFAAKAGDLDLRFTPAPTAQQGREGHVWVAQRRGPDAEVELALSTIHERLRVRGRADIYLPAYNTLEEVKTFRGRVDAIPANQNLLHWAQLKVYGWMLCEQRGLSEIRLCLLYLDLADQQEYPQAEVCSAQALREYFEALCTCFMAWSRQERSHRAARDAALGELAFPRPPFRPGQRALAEKVYRACTQSRTLLAQAPTGIGKTLGTLYPALRAMPVRGIDKLFFLSAKTPGRQVALEGLRLIATKTTGLPFRVIEIVAKDKVCEYPGKACHGEACPRAHGFYDRLPQAREAAVQAVWLDQAAVRDIARAHTVCPYYLAQEMLRWSDVVVGDYNYWFDRSAVLHALTVDAGWRVSVLVDEAHNLHARASAMYSAELTHERTQAVRRELPRSLRGPLDELLAQWRELEQAMLDAKPAAPDHPGAAGDLWELLDEAPDAWARALRDFNAAAADHLVRHPAQAPGPLLEFFFGTLGFAALLDAFGAHSLCEYTCARAAPPPSATQLFEDDTSTAGVLRLRNIVPGAFISERLRAAVAMVLFSATMFPRDYHVDLLGVPRDAVVIDVPSPFDPSQLAVHVVPLSTRRDRRAHSLERLVRSLQEQFERAPGNYIAYFSSHEYLAMAHALLREQGPAIPTWVQQRQMDEPARRAFLQRFQPGGRGVAFAVLGGVFSEGVDLPGDRLIGAFIATLGLPQFDRVNEAIRARLDERFGRGYDYTYLLPGLQKVVQAAGRVIRTEQDRGTLVLLDERYALQRYRALLPVSWGLDTPPERRRGGVVPESTGDLNAPEASPPGTRSRTRVP